MNPHNCGDRYCPANDDELAPWERELLRPLPLEPGEGHITFVTHDGHEVVLRNMRVDSVSPVGANKGTVIAERFSDERPFHVPNVAFWSVDYD